MLLTDEEYEYIWRAEIALKVLNGVEVEDVSKEFNEKESTIINQVHKFCREASHKQYYLLGRVTYGVWRKPTIQALRNEKYLFITPDFKISSQRKRDYDYDRELSIDLNKRK